MKILKKDLRNQILKLLVENLDDLWYLSQVISPNDVVRGKTQRRIKDKADQKSSGGERKAITLTLKVEKTQFKPETKVLRVSGVIAEGPDELVSVGSHHTINIDTNTQVTVKKQRWREMELDRLSDAVKSTHKPRILIASIDEGEASVGVLKESRIEYIDVSSNIGGKYDIKGRESRKQEFYSQVTAVIENISNNQDVSNIILCGPGFEKKSYHTHLSNKNPQIGEKTVVEDTGASGRNAIQEVLKRDVLRKAVADVNAVRDIRFMEDILAQIGKETGLAAYGVDEVRQAIHMKAVEKLVISDMHFFQKRAAVDPLMKEVKNMKGSIHIINSESEAGNMLDSLGGIAAKLRYKIS